jgi:hypothetical protein
VFGITLSIIIIMAALIAAYMAWNIGANDVANGNLKHKSRGGAVVYMLNYPPSKLQNGAKKTYIQY